MVFLWFSPFFSPLPTSPGRRGLVDLLLGPQTQALSEAARSVTTALQRCPERNGWGDGWVGGGFMMALE